MPVSALIAVQTLRSAHRRVSHGPLMPRVWRIVRTEWARHFDRWMA